MMKRCKSGEHTWDEKDERLEKCCNGWICISAPRTGFRVDETNIHPYSEDGDWRGIDILVHESEVDRLKRLRAMQPEAEQRDKNGKWVFN